MLRSTGMRVLTVAVFILMSGLIGYRIGLVHAPAAQGQGVLRLGRDTWTNPLLACSTSDQKDQIKLGVLETRLRSLIQQEKNTGKIVQASVYFRDLENGKATGVGENDEYASASLMKLPIMMAYLKQAESDPTILQSSLVYDGSFDTDEKQNIKPGERLQVGKSYSIQELIRRMIVESSNNSMILLLSRLKEDGLRAIYKDLSLPFSYNQDNDLLISPREYGLFFRTLYSATYLTRSMSEQALTNLNQVEFKDGLVAGLPENVRVSHKFGERVLQAQDGTSNAQLHDCGIIYHEKHPYILCVMTKGSSLSNLAPVIASFSKTTYSFIDKEYQP